MTNSAHQSKNFPNKNKNTTQHSHIGTHASRDNESGIDRKVCICNTKCNKDYFDERGWHGCRQWPPWFQRSRGILARLSTFPEDGISIRTDEQSGMVRQGTAALCRLKALYCTQLTCALCPIYFVFLKSCILYSICILYFVFALFHRFVFAIHTLGRITSLGVLWP